MKTIKTPTGTIKYYKNYVIKKLDNPILKLDQEWLTHYQAVADNNNYLVKVNRIVKENLTFEMERLDIVSDIAHIFNVSELRHHLTRNVVSEIYKAVNTTWIDSIQYSNDIGLEHGSYFLHGDMALKNILLLADGSVKIGDPESFHIMDRLHYAESYAAMHTHLMFGLQRLYRDKILPFNATHAIDFAVSALEEELEIEDR